VRLLCTRIRDENLIQNVFRRFYSLKRSRLNIIVVDLISDSSGIRKYQETPEKRPDDSVIIIIIF